MEITLEIQKLTIAVNLGVGEAERSTPQQVELDITYILPNFKSLQTDEIDDTIDYLQVSKSIIEHIKDKSYCLIEHLAYTIATILKNKFGMTSITVAVNKKKAIESAQNTRAICSV